jgi:hypothetical protein
LKEPVIDETTNIENINPNLFNKSQPTPEQEKQESKKKLESPLSSKTKNIRIKSEPNTPNNLKRPLKHSAYSKEDYAKNPTKIKKRKLSIFAELESLSGIKPTNTDMFCDKFLFDDEAEKIEADDSGFTSQTNLASLSPELVEKQTKQVISEFDLRPDTKVVFCKLSDFGYSIRKPTQIFL